jgi:hypothetical protein
MTCDTGASTVSRSPGGTVLTSTANPSGLARYSRPTLQQRAFNLARNSVRFGSSSGGPAVGAIVVWHHHVGIITGRSSDGWIVKSGNDGHAVRERERGAIASHAPQQVRGDSKGQICDCATTRRRLTSVTHQPKTVRSYGTFNPHVDFAAERPEVDGLAPQHHSLVPGASP